MEKDKQVLHLWQTFEAVYIPMNVDDIQRKEMKRSFFSGAHSLFLHMVTTLDPDHEPTVEDLDKMSGIHDELKAYAQACVEGRE